MIEGELGTSVDLKKGRHGQFDVVVDGHTVVSRKGGMLAMLTRRPWPSEDAVLDAIRQAAGQD